MNPSTPIIIPGNIKLRLQSVSTYTAATKVPSIFPRDVWEFQMPKIRPRLLLPNQFPTIVTTPGQPEVWKIPPNTYVKKETSKYVISY